VTVHQQASKKAQPIFGNREESFPPSFERSLCLGKQAIEFPILRIRLGFRGQIPMGYFQTSACFDRNKWKWVRDWNAGTIYRNIFIVIVVSQSNKFFLGIKCKCTYCYGLVIVERLPSTIRFTDQVTLTHPRSRKPCRLGRDPRQRPRVRWD